MLLSVSLNLESRAEKYQRGYIEIHVQIQAMFLHCVDGGELYLHVAHTPFTVLNITAFPHEFIS